MGNVIISADSTCDIGDELKERYGIRFFPYHILFRGRDYLDNVDITTSELYAGYYEDGSLPATSAINVQEYVDYFAPLVADGSEVVHLNLGAALSSSHEHALAAAEEVGNVHVVDSCSLSTGTGQLVIRAARMAESGMAAADIAREVEAMRPRTHASFVLDTLDFMAAGGRCPQVLAHVGKALKLKVEIAVDNRDGSMRVAGVHRGSLRKSMREYVETQVKRNPGIIRDDVFITHSGDIDPRIVDSVREQLHELLPGLERIHVTRASCTIASHCGPGTLGILFVTE